MSFPPPPAGAPPSGGGAPTFNPNPNPNFVQGSATAALTWVLYDVFLTWDREVASVWRASWSISKILFILARYHTLLALGFFLMEAIGTKHFILPLNIDTSNIPFDVDSPFYAPCLANLKSSIASRWYLGLTEVFSIMVGELLILVRINAVYGWSRSVVAVTMLLFAAESVIGLTTTILSINGGARGLFGSSGILTCHPGQANVPDVNLSSIYLVLILYKTREVTHVVAGANGEAYIQRMGILSVFKNNNTNMSPTLQICLRDAATYFVVIFCVLLVNLVLILSHDRVAQLGTPWLLSTYSVASTRIFLNLKGLRTATIGVGMGAGRWNTNTNTSSFRGENTSIGFIQSPPTTPRRYSYSWHHSVPRHPYARRWQDTTTSVWIEEEVVQSPP
ncbi:hypothetical protein C8F01DRAFT_1367442 [Mycena amicta]|nr:hypothetical protein C8F01DRAFT_1367442 [Mycena amicta]